MRNRRQKNYSISVMPAKAGIQFFLIDVLDASFSPTWTGMTKSPEGPYAK